MAYVKKISEFSGHGSAIYALEQAETDRIYSGSSDKVIAQWNLTKMAAEKFSVRLPAIVYSICYLADRNILLAGTAEGKIHVIDLTEKKELKILHNHQHPVFDIQYSADKKIVISASGEGTISIISKEDFSTKKVIKLCNEKIRAIDIYADQAAIACGDGMLRFLDLTNLTLKSEFMAHEGSVYAVKFSPDGNYLLSGGKDAHLKKWNFANNQWQNEKSIPAHNYAIYSIVFSPDKQYFATASRDKTIKIWKTHNEELLERINKEKHDGHMNSVNKLLWSKYDNYLISTGDDRKIMLWQIT